MTDLQKILEQFAAGRLDGDQVEDAVVALASVEAGGWTGMIAQLQGELAGGKLPTEVYARLIAIATRQTAEKAAAADRTVVASRSPAQARADRTSTLMRAVEVDEATRIGSPPTARPAQSSSQAQNFDIAPEEATRIAPSLADSAAPLNAVMEPVVSEVSGTENAVGEQTLFVPSDKNLPPPAEMGFAQDASNDIAAEADSPQTVATINGTQFDGTFVARSNGPGAPASQQEAELRVGSVLKDRFVLEEVLGGGGMGVVFKALDLRKSEARDKEPYVALKVLNAEFRENPLSLIALQRETKRTQTLSHPSIINVFDFDRDGNHVFMSMEHLSGKPLNRFIRDLAGQGMPFKKAWPLIKQMGEALGYAHQKDIIHSDFKPGNVFVSDANEVKVLDFGIACVAERAEKKNSGDHTLYDARKEGALTPAYASLEMLEGKDPDPTDDIYALGCVAYELLAGKHPYGKLQADKALELKLQPPAVPGLNRRQWRGLQRALALRREQRTRSVEAFLSDLGGRSPVFYSLWALGLAAVAATGTSIYLGFNAPVEAPRPAVVLNAEQQSKIHDLLELAGIHFEVGYLTAPTGSNALWAYREVLKIDPYNDDAMKGLGKIADALEQKAWEAFERGDRAESLKSVVDGLEAVPDHQGLMALRAKLER